jgi:hypothetical protein
MLEQHDLLKQTNLVNEANMHYCTYIHVRIINLQQSLSEK